MNDGPKEIRQPIIYGNFRPSRVEREKAKRTHKSAQERRDGNCEAHLALLRLSPCAISLKVPAGEVHHLKSGPAGLQRGMGMRATDRYGIPLIHALHMDLESYGSRREYEWFAAHGLMDPIGLADALYMAQRDLEVYAKIIYAHRRIEPIV